MAWRFTKVHNLTRVDFHTGTGHASPTAGAASAMLLILLIQVIGDGVTRSAEIKLPRAGLAD